MSSFKQLRVQLDAYDIVRRFADISDNGMTVCPFHNDTNPSMSVSQESGMVKCWACGHTCDIIEYYAKQMSMTNVEAAKELAKEVGTDFDVKVNESTALLREEMNNALKLKSDRHVAYLMGRGIEEAGINEFKLGGIGDWVVQPIFDHDNKLAYINKRSMTDPKGHMLNKDITKVAGGLSTVKRMKGPLIITEGYFDVVQAWQEGYPAVSLFGWSMSDYQAECCLKYFDDFILALDNDEAGIGGACEAYRLIKSLSPASEIIFADFDTKDLGDWLYRNDTIPTVSYYEWAKKSNISRKEILETIKYSMTPIERRLSCLAMAKDHGLTIDDVKEELEII